mmetsp:Transcript_29573/g.54187  ORF Transcript_29573/g.54187 Transcript_29573/m.54187 type:complete len:80 (-) Transcript_29573:854-1093(-)
MCTSTFIKCMYSIVLVSRKMHVDGWEEDTLRELSIISSIGKDLPRRRHGRRARIIVTGFTSFPLGEKIVNDITNGIAPS